MDSPDERAARELFGSPKVIDLPRQPPLAEPWPATETAGGQVQDDPGPDFSGTYQAFGRQHPYPLRCLVLYFNAAERRKYGKKKMQIQYEHLDSDDPVSEGFAADGQSFSFVVAGGRKVQRVTVRGRQLERGYDLLIAQRIGWIRSADRDFGHSDGPFIGSLEIEPVGEEG